MKIPFSTLQDIYIVAKSKSKGLIDDMQTEIEINESMVGTTAYKNGELIYANYDTVGVYVPNPETHQNLGHGASRLKEHGD